MANSASSEKRVRQNQRNRVRNRARKNQLKRAVKAFREAVHDGDVNKADKLLVAASRTLDQVASKGTIHRKTASRKKSRLAKAANKLKAGKS